MDYTKYLNCKDCQDSGLYYHIHRKEAGHELKKQELQNVLQIRDTASSLYKKVSETCLHLIITGIPFDG